jgi:hypothetical protein
VLAKRSSVQEVIGWSPQSDASSSLRHVRLSVWIEWISDRRLPLQVSPDTPGTRCCWEESKSEKLEKENCSAKINSQVEAIVVDESVAARDIHDVCEIFDCVSARQAVNVFAIHDLCSFFFASARLFTFSLTQGKGLRIVRIKIWIFDR